MCFDVQFKPEEIAATMRDFDEPGTLAPTGLHLGGTKYMVIQGEPGAVIRGKKVSLDNRGITSDVYPSHVISLKKWFLALYQISIIALLPSGDRGISLEWIL